MTRKWIDARLEMLDPETDYDEIWKLSAGYRPNDFIMNLIYLVTFAHFFVREHDAIPLIDGGRGKILTDPHDRADATSWKQQVWWHHGSQHAKTQQSVESVNRLHAHHAQRYPDSFSHNDSYLYTLCYEAAGPHRLQQRVGLPGYSEKQKIAATRYWANVTELFRNATTGEPVTGFPDSFDAIEQYMDRYEAEDVPENELSPRAARALLQQFADRYFPKILHPVVRSWGVSLLPDHLVKAYRLEKPPTWAVRAYRLLTKGIFLMGEKVLPDPTHTFTERRAAAKAAPGRAGRVRSALTRRRWIQKRIDTLGPADQPR